MTEGKIKQTLAAVLAVGALAIAVPARSFAAGGGPASAITSEPGDGGH